MGVLSFFEKIWDKIKAHFKDQYQAFKQGSKFKMIVYSIEDLALAGIVFFIFSSFTIIPYVLAQGFSLIFNFLYELYAGVVSASEYAVLSLRWLFDTSVTTLKDSVSFVENIGDAMGVFRPIVYFVAAAPIFFFGEIVVATYFAMEQIFADSLIRKVYDTLHYPIKLMQEFLNKIPIINIFSRIVFIPIDLTLVFLSILLGGLMETIKGLF